MATQNQIRLAQVLNEKAFQSERLRIQNHELSESIRSNMAREAEQRRSNRAHEQLGWAQYQEGVRSNLAREHEAYRSNVAREWQGLENIRVSSRSVAIEHDRARELARHNQAQEAIDQYKSREQGRHNKVQERQNRIQQQDYRYYKGLENSNESRRLDLQEWKNKRDNWWTGVNSVVDAAAKFSKEASRWVR